MREEWLKLREEVMFKTSAQEFQEKIKSVRLKYDREFNGASEQRKGEIADILSELTIDLGSYLKRWHLQAERVKDKISDEIIEKEKELNLKLIKKWKTDDKIPYIKKEENSINKSNMLRLSKHADEGKINNRWGNDYASGLAEAMRKGAVLATTNPPLINNERKENPLYWDKVKESLKKEYPDVSSARLASIMTMKVVLKNCRELRPVFEASEGRYGYLSFQVNPKNSTDTGKMIEEAEFIYRHLESELSGTPNVVFKLPGTKAAIEAAKVLTEKRIGVNITLGFSTDQHLAFAKAIESGNAQVSFLVMMSGRLDDPIAEELEKVGVEDAKEVAKHASGEVIKKSYYELYKRRKYKKSSILVASLRGPWNIDASITDDEIPIYITSFPDKTEEYDSINREILSHMDEVTPEDIMEKLKKSSIFRKAYGIDSMMPSDFDSFYPVVVTLKSFATSYDEFVKYVED